MSTFRSDRVALRHRIESLEAELADARKRGDPADIQRKLDDLRQQVARAASDIEQDRAAIADVSSALDKFRTELELGPSSSAASQMDRPRGGRGAVIAILVAIVAGIAIAGMLLDGWRP